MAWATPRSPQTRYLASRWMVHALLLRLIIMYDNDSDLKGLNREIGLPRATFEAPHHYPCGLTAGDT
eukprot:3253259-Alexandrium_andersonii.AAC.1